VHPNELHLFRRLDSPGCCRHPDIFRGRVLFQRKQTWADIRSSDGRSAPCRS